MESLKEKIARLDAVTSTLDRLPHDEREYILSKFCSYCYDMVKDNGRCSCDEERDEN